MTENKWARCLQEKRAGVKVSCPVPVRLTVLLGAVRLRHAPCQMGQPPLPVPVLHSAGVLRDYLWDTGPHSQGLPGSVCKVDMHGAMLCSPLLPYLCLLVDTCSFSLDGFMVSQALTGPSLLISCWWTDPPQRLLWGWLAWAAPKAGVLSAH